MAKVQNFRIIKTADGKDIAWEFTVERGKLEDLTGPSRIYQEAKGVWVVGATEENQRDLERTFTNFRSCLESARRSTPTPML